MIQKFREYVNMAAEQRILAFHGTQEECFNYMSSVLGYSAEQHDAAIEEFHRHENTHSGIMKKPEYISLTPVARTRMQRVIDSDPHIKSLLDEQKKKQHKQVQDEPNSSL